MCDLLGVQCILRPSGFGMVAFHWFEYDGMRELNRRSLLLLLIMLCGSDLM